MASKSPAEASASTTDAATEHRAAQVVVVTEEQGQRLDNFLLARLKGLPRSRVYRMVRRGEVRVNGARPRPSQRLREGDAVRIPPHRAAVEKALPTAPAQLLTTLGERTLYEDEDVLVLDKPSGLAVHGGSGVSLGVVEALRQAKPQVRYELAHRLDRDTSGCLLLAKRRAALLRLHAQFRNGEVRKRYTLIVAGCWPRRLGTVTEPLERYRLANGERRVRVSGRGEAARTDFAVCRTAADATWLVARPRSGRTHQIRVHAAVSGHSILGDDKYALPDAPAAPRLMLHASAIECEVGGSRRRFVAPLPAAFAAWWGAREEDSTTPAD